MSANAVLVPAVPLDLEQTFLTLASRWKAERGPTSFSSEMAAHPAYQEIVTLGPPVIPLLLRELERDPDHWFTALRTLTGANPVPPQSRGKLREMADAWIAWGREKGHRTEIA